MLTITIPHQEYYDESTNSFNELKRDYVLKLQHSLISISKWEEIYEKPYLETKLTPEEFIDYIKCMTVNQDVPDMVYTFLTYDDVKKIADYINAKATATIITNFKKSGPQRKEKLTSDLIYYYMLQNEIPFDPCEKWRLNRLLTLIEICAAKGNPTSMSKKEIYAMNKQLNASRRAKLGSPG